MADKQISQLVAATTVNDEDLLVMQQGGTAKKLSGRTLGDYVYSAAAEKIAEVDQAIDEEIGIARSEIEQMIAGVEEDMTATTNYTTDSLVVADNKLYKLTADVATGQTLTPGSNCTQTTIAAVLDELRVGLGASDAGGVTYSDSETYETGSVGEKLQALDSSVTTLGADVDTLEEDLGTLEDTVNGSFSDSTITDVAIATFSDGVAGTNLKKITVGMSPVQDLHGYDTPWPAGGGKNKAGSLESGTFMESRDSGSTFSSMKTANSKRCRSADLVSVAGSEFTVSWADYNTYSCCCIFFDSDGLYLGQSSGFMTWQNQSFTVNNPSVYYVACAFKKSDNSDTTESDISSISLQVELGSSATAYAPYENTCPITGWTECNVSTSNSNLFDGVVTNQRVVDGVVTNTGTWRLSGFIPVEVGKAYTLIVEDSSVHTAAGMTLWSIGKEYIGTYSYGTTTPYQIQEGVKYLRFHVSSTAWNNNSGKFAIVERTDGQYNYEAHQGTTIPYTFPVSGKNLFNKDATDTSRGYVSGKYLNANGAETAPSSGTVWNTSEYIQVDPSSRYTLSGLPTTSSSDPSVCWYDESKQLISALNYGNYSSVSFSTTSASKYVRISIPQANINSLQFEKGSSATSYEPYNNTVYSGTLTINEDGSGELLVNKRKLVGTSYTLPSVRTDGYYARLNVDNSYINTNVYADYLANIATIGAYASNHSIESLKVAPAGPTGTTMTWVHCYIPGSLVNYDPEGSLDLTQCLTRDVPPVNFEIVAPLVEPITYPLTAQQVISVLNGENNVWADAGNIAELTYYTQAQPGIRDYIDAAYSDIEHMLSGVESEMVATRNYAEGALFVAEHKLYNATTSIASGDELVPGTNCNITTVEAQLNAVRSSIAALDAAKVDKSAFLAAITGTYDIYPTDTLTDQVVAHFTDGANDVPVKKLVARINPVQSGTGDPSPENVRPISGWTGCKISGTGKNLWGGLRMAQDIAAISSSCILDTSAKTITLSNLGSVNLLTDGITFRENTRYTLILKCSNSWGNATNITFEYTDGTYTNVNGLSGADTVGTIVKVSTSNKTVACIKSNQQAGTTTIYYEDSGLFEGEITADQFESYTGERNDITFPEKAGTVCQGTLTINEDGSGILLNKSTILTVSASSISVQTSYSYQNIDYAIFAKPANAKLRDIMNSVDAYCICDRAPINRSKSNFDNASIIGSLAVGAQGAWFWFGFEKGTSLDDMKAALDGMEIVYELGDSYTTAYTLTAQQVKTLLGENNIWADTGNVDVTYRADSGLYIAKKIAEAIT